MNDKQLQEDRILVARMVIENLKKYGNIEPPGFYGRPVHGTDDAIYQMSKANYLRTAVYLKEDSPKNPHYISRLEALSLNLHPVSDARPVFLEEWSGNQRSGYNVELVPYFNVDELSGTHPRIDALRGVIPTHDGKEDYKRFIAYIGRENLTLSDWQLENQPQAYKDTIFKDIKNVALHAGKDNITATLFAQLVMKEHRINRDGESYQLSPLFKQDDLLVFEANPQTLYDAINDATTLLKSFVPQQLQENQQNLFATIEPKEEKPVHDEQETSNDDITATEEKEEQESSSSSLFSSLSIHLDFCDAPITDAKGELYNENIDLNGEEAYEFLAKMLEMDKEFFNDKHPHCDGKTRLTFSYNGYKHNDGASFRIDLGDLEFQNKKSVYEALIARLNSYYNFLLSNDQGAKMCLNLHKDEEDCPSSIEDLRAEVRMEIMKFNAIFSPFKEEEEQYLAKHPEYAEMNRKDAEPFIYICKKDDYTGSLKQYTFGEVPREKLKGFCTIPCGYTFDSTIRSYLTQSEHKNIPMMYQKYLAVRDDLPDSMMAVYGRSRPSYMDKEPCLAVVHENKLHKLQALNKFHIIVKSKSSVLALKERQEEYSGYKALKYLHDLKNMDGTAFLDACRNQCFVAGDACRYKITLAYDNKVYDSINYLGGAGQFSQMNLLPSHMSDKQGRKDFIDALSFYAHISADCSPYLAEDLMKPDRRVVHAIKDNNQLPDAELSLSTMKTDQAEEIPAIPKGRGDREYYQDCYSSFRKYGLVNPANDTPEKVWIDAIKRMAETGRSLSHITTIVKNFSNLTTQEAVKSGELCQKLVKTPELRDYIKKQQQQSKVK